MSQNTLLYRDPTDDFVEGTPDEKMEDSIFSNMEIVPNPLQLVKKLSALMDDMKSLDISPDVELKDAAMKPVKKLDWVKTRTRSPLYVGNSIGVDVSNNREKTPSPQRSPSPRSSPQRSPSPRSSPQLSPVYDSRSPRANNRVITNSYIPNKVMKKNRRHAPSSRPRKYSLEDTKSVRQTPYRTQENLSTSNLPDYDDSKSSVIPLDSLLEYLPGTEMPDRKLRTGRVKFDTRPDKYSKIIFSGDYVFKVWINEDNANFQNSTVVSRDHLEEFKYESLIYDRIHEMLKFPILPPFVQYIYREIGVPVKNLITRDYIDVDGQYIKNIFTESVIKDLRDRLLYTYKIKTDESIRYHRIPKNSIVYQNIMEDLQRLNSYINSRNLRISYLLTVNDMNMSVEEYLYKLNVQSCSINIPIHMAVWIFILIIRACNYMHDIQVVHNDLHYNNILLSVIEGIPFPKIYDYDRAYCPKIGDNPVLNSSLCTKFDECNQFDPRYNTDIYTAFYMFFGFYINSHCTNSRYGNKIKYEVIKKISELIHDRSTGFTKIEYANIIIDFTKYYGRQFENLQTGEMPFLHKDDNRGVRIGNSPHRDRGRLLRSVKKICNHLMDNTFLAKVVQRLIPGMYDEYSASSTRPLTEEEFTTLIVQMWDGSTLI